MRRSVAAIPVLVLLSLFLVAFHEVFNGAPDTTAEWLMVDVGALVLAILIFLFAHNRNPKTKSYVVQRRRSVQQQKEDTVKLDKKVWLYGLAVWATPFVVAMVIFPLRQTERALFESIMPVVVTLAAVVFSDLYFENLQTAFFKTGIALGTLWFLISWILDTLLFARGPMQMSLGEYAKDIGLTYLIIPTVTIGYGWLMEKKSAPIKPETNPV